MEKLHQRLPFLQITKPYSMLATQDDALLVQFLQNAASTVNVNVNVNV
jgi:hypothetical protein